MALGLTWNLPLWTVLPFVVLLLGIALLPLCAPRWWEKNGNKLKFALLCGVPAAVFIAVKASELGVPFTLHDHPILVALHEYVAFTLLLLALFVVSGGIHVNGTLAGTPLVNTAILAFGALIASFVGTTGASMLLIRPLLRANAARRRKSHVVIFFIFIVANCGGLLTPLGDPPLFLGFLRGVPFTWTFSLWKAWLLVNGVLLIVFQLLDSHYFHREDVDDERRDLDTTVERRRKPLRIEGGVNLFLLLGVIGVIYFSGRQQWGARWPGLQEAALLGLAILSIFFTKKEVRARNGFTWAPIVEVAVLFLGIFLAMIPALRILHDAGSELGIASPRAFFWATGLLSSFLDNAPTYLTFTSVACGMEQVAPEGQYLAEFLDPARGATNAGPILAAISCGAVFMGANTYIGNGPNFMVKAIAQAAGVKMPGFLGYMAWSGAILIPLFVVVTFVIF